MIPFRITERSIDSILAHKGKNPPAECYVIDKIKQEIQSGNEVVIIDNHDPNEIIGRVVIENGELRKHLYEYTTPIEMPS